jgi:uncharacterized membrane protein
MNPEHIHLFLNHLPTIGFGIGLAFFVFALLLKQPEVERAALVIFFLTAALTISTYVSGNDAREALKDTPGISDPLMRAHETAALIATVFMELTGFFSWIGLWIWDRSARFKRVNAGIILVLATLTFVLMARAGYFGGAIRHPETEAAQTIPLEDPSIPTLAQSWGVFVQDHSWVWPACETVHFVGLSLLFGVVLILNLRMLGVGKTMLSSAALFQLLPVGMLGFGLNLVTGMMFFVAMPQQYTGFLFFLKMALVAAGAINLLFFMLVRSPSNVGYGDDAGPWTKVMAASAILIWTAVLFCGHMLPWLGNSF